MTDKPKGLKTYPFVSVITPTYNRKRFIPYLIEDIEGIFNKDQLKSYTEGIMSPLSF